MDILLLGNIKLKRYNYFPLTTKAERYLKENPLEVYEVNLRDYRIGDFNEEYYIREFKKLINFKFQSERRREIIYFKDVDSHTDKFWDKLNNLNSYFLHVVIRGKGYLRTHRNKKSIRIKDEIFVKRGDVFLLNPRCVHSFEIAKGSKMVGTFCLTVSGINSYRK